MLNGDLFRIHETLTENTYAVGPVNKDRSSTRVLDGIRHRRQSPLQNVEAHGSTQEDIDEYLERTKNAPEISNTNENGV